MPRPTTNHQDVVAFHKRLGIPVATRPAQLTIDEAYQRIRFMREELEEYEAAVVGGDLTKQFDALLDLTYVTHGTAAMQGLPFDEGWDLVHAANMRKERRPDDGTGYKHGVVKPEGWEAPDDALHALIRQRLAAPEVEQLELDLEDQLQAGGYLGEPDRRYGRGFNTGASR